MIDVIVHLSAAFVIMFFLYQVIKGVDIAVSLLLVLSILFQILIGLNPFTMCADFFGMYLAILLVNRVAQPKKVPVEYKPRTPNVIKLIK